MRPHFSHIRLALRLTSVLAYALCPAVNAQPVSSNVELDAETNMVITPTRLKQSKFEVPAAVTVITAEMIRTYGIRSLADAMRLVPGMAVTHVTGNDLRVNYHGTNILVPRRMTLLLDGVSMYRPGLSRIDWKELPVAIEDVERIEVTRGANSAAYGPNAMMAVVNVITRHGADAKTVQTSAMVGSDRSYSGYVGVSESFGSLHARASISTDHDRGVDTVSRGAVGHDDTTLRRASLRLASDLDATSSIDVSLGGSTGRKDVPFADAYQKSFPDQFVDDAYASAVFRKQLGAGNEVQAQTSYSSNRIKQEWITCPPSALFLPEMGALWRANPGYALAIAAGKKPSGGTAADDALARQALAAIAGLGARATRPNCVTANQNLVQTRADVEVQDAIVVSPHLRGVVGLGLRQEHGDSQTLIGPENRYSSGRLFGHFEYRLTPALVFNGGAYLQKIDGLPVSFQPRAALNYLFAPNHAVRAVFANGVRSPDMLERDGVWSYSVTDLQFPINGSRSARYFQSGRSAVSVGTEKIRNRELGYVYFDRKAGTSLDVKAFHDELTDLISEKLSVATFNPTNNGRVTLSGVEAQGVTPLAEGVQLIGHYAFLENRKASTASERSQFSRHSGSLGVSAALPAQWTASVLAVAATGDGVGQSSTRRVDGLLGKSLRVADANVTAALSVSYNDVLTTTYFNDTNVTLSSRLKNRVSSFMKIAVSF
jgi:iron complex outermembrane recepter protein